MSLYGLSNSGYSFGWFYVNKVQVSCILATLTFWISVFYHHPDFKHTVSASCYQYERVISQFIHVTKAHVCDVVVVGCVYSGVQLKAVGKQKLVILFHLEPGGDFSSS